MTHGPRFFGSCALALAAAACSDPGSGATRFGTILLESDSTPEPVQLASGAFYRLDSEPVAGKCHVVEEVGACRLWQCDDYAPPSALKTSPLSAGTVQVTGANTTLQLEEEEPGSYAWTNDLNLPLWDGGEPLLLTVGGSEAFPASAVSLFAPDPVTLTAPLVPAEGWRLDSRDDLALAWSDAVESHVFVAISVAVPDPEGSANLLFPGLDCGFFGAARAAVVPASLLTKLARPAGIAGHQIEVLTYAAEAARVDDALLNFRATSFALSALATIE